LRLKEILLLTIVVDHPLDPVLQQSYVKIDQQSDWNVQEAQVREKLCLSDRMQGLLALKFQYQLAVHNKIRPEAAVSFTAS
jgi:hypothetical protein